MKTTEFKKLSFDEKYNLAANNETSSGTLVSLARDKHPWIREALIQNENTPSDTLALITQDERSYIKNMAKEALEERKTKAKYGVER